MECRLQSYLSYIYIQIFDLGSVLTTDNIIEAQQGSLKKETNDAGSQEMNNNKERGKLVE